MIHRLLEAGVNVFRLNASHGTAAEHSGRVGRIRAAAAEAGHQPAVLLDLQGPKIRLGTFEGGSASLQTGDRFTITTQPCQGNERIASTTYSGLARDVKRDDRILLNDGAVELRVCATDGTAVDCEVVTGGFLADRKGINLPGVTVSAPALTKKDMADLISGLEAGVDLVALSFVRSRDDMMRLRYFLDEHDVSLPLIAKIEKPEAWEHLDEILDASSGVMVARGDLGVEMPLEKVPFIQKSIIERARSCGRFVITATQMLESMIDHPVPTRAEVSDIANAIHDGTDAVMLSGETSTGRYPLEAVRVMARVAREAEATLRPEHNPDPGAHTEHPEIVAASAWRAAQIASASAIVVFTTSGGTARLVSRYRPTVPVFAFTPTAARARQLSIVFGVHAMEAPPPASTDQMLAQMDHILVERGLVKPGEVVVFVAGQPIGQPGSTNMMKLHRVG